MVGWEVGGAVNEFLEGVVRLIRQLLLLCLVVVIISWTGWFIQRNLRSICQE